jgi:superfamily I DNA/RNA helicase
MQQTSLAAASPVSAPSRSWSPLQRAIFDDVAKGTGHTVVLARAGSGKTTTIVEALTHIPRGSRTLLCAFNKDIERELTSRAPAGVVVSTLHRLGLRTLTASIGRKAIDAEKGFKLASELIEGDRPYDKQQRRIVLKLAGLAKGSGRLHSARTVGPGSTRAGDSV